MSHRSRETPLERDYHSLESQLSELSSELSELRLLAADVHAIEAEVGEEEGRILHNGGHPTVPASPGGEPRSPVGATRAAASSPARWWMKPPDAPHALPGLQRPRSAAIALRVWCGTPLLSRAMPVLADAGSRLNSQRVSAASVIIDAERLEARLATSTEQQQKVAVAKREGAEERHGQELRDACKEVETANKSVDEENAARD